jgi:hypothetical protein
MGVLQDPVVVVSLIRTLTDSFGSASDLYRKLKRSSGSDDEDDGPKGRRRRPPRRRDSSSSDRDRGLGRLLGNKNKEKDSYGDSDEQLISEASHQIQAEYDRGYRKIGEPYARGDCKLTWLCAQTRMKLTGLSDGKSPHPVANHLPSRDYA